MIKYQQFTKTRLAPSPTGHLHLGHVFHVMAVQSIAAKYGAAILLRLEDHDQSRYRPEFEASILDDLLWLGVQIPENIWRQSQHYDLYQHHLENLMKDNLVYACRCSRKDLRSPNTTSEPIYPGSCRELGLPLDGPGTCLRVKLPEGDVVIRDRHHQWTYQFSVVVDDLWHKIDLVVRGLDLLPSTGSQLALRALLLRRTADATDLVHPGFIHHPLILDSSGIKLSKGLGSEGLKVLRQKGFSPDEVRGLAATRAGLLPESRPLSLERVNQLEFASCL